MADLIALMTEDLDEAKRQAAVQDTYGDHWKLEEFLVEQLDFLRGAISQRRREARWWLKMADRAQLAGLVLDEDALEQRFARRNTATADALSAIRDEMRAGLRYMRAEYKQHTEQLSALCREIRAERGES